MDIEKLATSAIKSSISKTDRLSSFLSEGDKEPAWDGNIYIHENKRKSKKNIKKVPTQIKGKIYEGKVEDTIRYPIDISDLEDYQKNGGALYFVVYLDMDGETLQIYYTSLLPFKISELLKGKKNTTSLTVTLQKFPDDKDEKTGILLDYHNHAQKQASFAGKDLPTVADLQKQGTLESLTVHYTGMKRGDYFPILPQITDGKEMFVYANVKNSPIPIPVEYYQSVTHMQMSQEINRPVCVGDTKFFDSYTLINRADTFTIRVGSCLTITVPQPQKGNQKSKTDITITTKGTLNQRLEAIPFLSAMLTAKTVTVGGLTIPFDYDPEKLKSIHYETFDEELAYLRQIRKVLDQLHVQKDLDLSKCNDMDYWKLDNLIGAIEEGTETYGVKGELPSIVNLHIANLHFVLLCKKEEDGGYHLWDYFDKNISVVILDDNDDPHPVSQFSIMKKDDFLNTDNLYLDAIPESFKSVENADEYNPEQANLVMLEIINAYDESKDVELLTCAEAISDWLLSLGDEPSDIALLNKMQIVLRQRSLSFEEKQAIGYIATHSTEPLQKVGAFILLKEWDEVKKSLSDIPEKTQNEFKKYPIYNLYKPREEK